MEAACFSEKQKTDRQTTHPQFFSEICGFPCYLFIGLTLNDSFEFSCKAIFYTGNSTVAFEEDVDKES